MRTLYDNLSDMNVSWRIYYHDVPQSMALSTQHKYFLSKYELFDAFIRDCRQGLLPQYSFIEPRYFNEGASRANDQHPIHGVVLGENLIADVYEALRASPTWAQTLLIVTWDEHGGFYDHVLPPKTVNPEGLNAPGFDFSRLGARVPSVVVSPYIPAGTIDSRILDHASIAATARKVFGLKAPLTKRDSQASSLEGLMTLREPRIDAPTTLERPQTAEQFVAENLLEDIAPNDLQASLVALSESLAPSKRATLLIAAPPRTEADAGARARAAMEELRATPPHA